MPARKKMEGMPPSAREQCFAVPVPGEEGRPGAAREGGREGGARRHSCSNRWLRRHQMAWDGSGDVGLAVAVWRRGGRGGFVAGMAAARMLIRLNSLAG